MSTTIARNDGEGRLPASTSNAIVLGTFAGTLFLSALLLFSVQPVFAKMVLPKLGGTPSVWAVSMCFFQAALLAGYCYAHALNRWLPARIAPLCHLALCGVAALALPFGLPEMGDPPAGDAYLWLIGVLTLGVGLPFFAVSANAPLLQAWFARTGHPSAADPYFLYGASNLGSFVALLAYPFLIEPALGLTIQSAAWTGGFLILVALIAGCGLLTALNASVVQATQKATSDIRSEPVTWTQRSTWIGLAAVPSGLLVAFSTYISTDIASAPLLWVIPLAMFLATFMLVFCERPPIPHRWMLLLQPVFAAIAVLGVALPGSPGALIGSTFGVGAYFITMMVCHRELYEHRPSSAHLTEFYLWMSFGGVLGGVFAAIVAPQIFNALYELPLLLLAGMLCRPGLSAAFSDARQRRNALVVLGAGCTIVAAIAIVCAAGTITESSGLHIAAILYIAGAALMFLVGDNKLPQLSIAAVVGLVLILLPSAQNMGHSERSFFGVHRVQTMSGGIGRKLLHGTTLHGIERLIDDQGRPIERPVPASYYHPASPMALGIDIARRSATGDRQFNAGVVGLGTGSMACYARPADAWRFYEIDPVVVRIASDASLFRFLAKCQPRAFST